MNFSNNKSLGIKLHLFESHGIPQGVNNFKNENLIFRITITFFSDITTCIISEFFLVGGGGGDWQINSIMTLSPP